MKTGLPELHMISRSVFGGVKRRLYLAAKICLGIILFTLFTILFYRQAVEYNGEYFSDLPAHINFGLNGGNYSLIFGIMGAIYKLPWPNVAIALFESSIVVSTFLMAEKYLHEHFDVSAGCLMWVAAASLFLCSIYIPRYYQYYYSWSLITQPWHNITYFGMRLFSIPVFFYTLRILDRYRQNLTWKDWLCIALPLLLSAAIKPNFLVDYSLTLLCVLIADFVRDCFRKELTTSSFLRYVCLGSTVFPAVIVLFYQMYVLYGGDGNSESGIAIVLWTSQFFSLGMLKTIIGIIRDTALPLLVAVCGYKAFSRKEKFVYLFFVVTLIQRIVLEETGLRAYHGNFTWGIYNAGYLLFLYMVPKFMQLVKMETWKQKNLLDKCFALTGSGLLCVHLFFGLRYFLILLSGKGYVF